MGNMSITFTSVLVAGELCTLVRKRDKESIFLFSNLNVVT